MIGFEQHAYLQVITGPMGSGKSDDMVKIAKKIKQYSKYDCQAFVPSIDNRFSNSAISSRNEDSFPATSIYHERPKEIIEKLREGVDIILLEEVNFMGDDLVDVVKVLLANDKRILASGLDLDFRGNPFGPMGHLLALANKVIKKQAFCEYENDIGEKCGEIATRTQRLLNGNPAPYDDPLIVVGALVVHSAKKDKVCMSVDVLNQLSDKKDFVKALIMHELYHILFKSKVKENNLEENKKSEERAKKAMKEEFPELSSWLMG